MLPAWIQTNQYTGGNTVELVCGGKPFFDALERLIQEAKDSLHIQSYIFNPDETGQKVLRLLYDAAARGVHVFLLLDAYGSLHLGKPWIAEIKQAGVNIRFFGHFFSKNLSIGRRLHHKLAVADGEALLISGINIADRYNDLPDQPAWLDYGVHVQGPLAAQALRRAQQIWDKKRWARLRKSKTNTSEGVRTRLSANDWLRGSSEITARLRYAIQHAQSDIIIAAAYFVPTARMLFELRKAVRRGVRVRLLLGKYSDVGMALRATRFLYDWLFRHGIEVYEFTGGIIHAKVAVIDGCWSTVGSYNLNYLSTFESLELNVDIADYTFGNTLKTTLEHTLETRCERILPEQYFPNLKRTDRIINGTAFVLLWLTAYLFSFLHRRTEKN